MKNIILYVILATSIVLAQSQNYTLKQSIEIGLKNSKDLKISQSKVIGSDAKITETTSMMLPEIKFMAAYTRLSSVPPFEVSLPILPNSIVISPSILNNYNLRLSLQQPLFTGFRLSSLRSAAKYNYDAQELDFQKEKNTVALKIQTAFWNYYKAEQAEKLLNDNLDQIKQHLEDTKNFMKNGLATRNDVLKLEVQYSNIQLQKIEAENNLDIARMAFNQALGLPVNAQSEIDAKSINAMPVQMDANDLTEEAKTNREDLKSLEMRVKASAEGITAAKSSWFPAVYLTGNYYYNRPNQRYIPAVDEFKDTWDVGVSLSWDLFTWGKRSAQATEAEQNKLQIETSLSQLKDGIEIEVYQSYLTYKRSYQKVQVSKLSVKQAEENYRIIKEKYNTQVASSTDLIDSETSLLQAKTNLNNSLVDYELAKVTMEKALGRKIY